MKKRELVLFSLILIGFLMIVPGVEAGCNSDCAAMSQFESGGCYAVFDCTSKGDPWDNIGSIGHGCWVLNCCCRKCDGVTDWYSDRCEANCGADSDCDEKVNNKAWRSGNTCYWCDSNCGYDYDSSGCAGGTCTVGGWTGCSGGVTPPTPPTPPTPTPTPPTIPFNRCSYIGDTRCTGLKLETCANQGGYLDWDFVENPSPQCCQEAGGDWLEGQGAAGCCGDTGVNDLGLTFGDKICLDDGGYKWITGTEKGRYPTNEKRIIFCEGKWSICADDAPYYRLSSKIKLYCDNKCGYYCDPLNEDSWVPDNNPELLNDTLGDGEKINTSKDAYFGEDFGCCPSNWCFNGTKCIEDQKDESNSLYVINDENTLYRCQDGDWTETKKLFNWDFSLQGHCEDSENQCLVSFDNYSNNNLPDLYHTDEKPQCISKDQYILDYYCEGGNWTSRTAILATKMMEVVDAKNKEFKIYCDSYERVLNDFSYSISSIPVESYLDESCIKEDEQIPCVNNFCIIRFKENNEFFELFGTSMNVAFGDSTRGFSDVIDVSTGSCEHTKTDGMWDFTKCGDSAIHNPNASLIIFSPAGVEISNEDSSWDIFINLIADPISLISELIGTGTFQYNDILGTQLSFDVLRTSKLFQRLFIAQIDPYLVQGVLEDARWDEELQKSVYYMLVTYKGFDDNICEIVNEFSESFGVVNCEGDPAEKFYVVLDARASPTFLMSKWPDLTSKFRPLLI